MHGATIAFMIGAVLSGVVALPPPARAGDGSPSPDQTTAADALVHYCRACHGVGALRFIRGTDSADVWQTIQTEVVPGTSTVWRDAIIAALDWPGATPPAAGSERAPGKEWMPKGVVRDAIARDVLGDETARMLLLRVLRAAR
jgi:hypothetical protein